MATPLDRQVSKLIKKFNKISNVEVPRANSSALNKSAQRVKTRVVRGVAKKEKLPQKIIRKRLFIRRSTQKTQKALVSVYARDIPAVSLLKTKALLSHARRGNNRRGVKVAGRQFNGAFINVVRGSGRFHVLKRKGKARMPIDVVKISINDTAESVTKTVSMRVMRDVYPKLIAHELSYRLEKYKR